jgi:hypothetical protein
VRSRYVLLSLLGLPGLLSIGACDARHRFDQSTSVAVIDTCRTDSEGTGLATGHVKAASMPDRYGFQIYVEFTSGGKLLGRGFAVSHQGTGTWNATSGFNATFLPVKCRVTRVVRYGPLPPSRPSP